MGEIKNVPIRWSTERHSEAKSLKDQFEIDTGEKINWEDFVYMCIIDHFQQPPMEKKDDVEVVNTEVESEKEKVNIVKFEDLF
jgi:hypothetical protein